MILVVNRLEKLKNSRLGFALLLLVAISCGAETWQSQQLNCAISLPQDGGWTHVNPPTDMVKVSIRSADRTKIISVFVAAMTPGASEADFIERFKQKWFGAGTGKSQVEERTRIDGHVAYRFKDIANLNGKLVHRADTLVVDAGKLYQINVLGTVTDPLLDPAVKQCVESFHFLTPPQARAKP